MRRGRKSRVIQNEEGGDFIGINLGADYCSEHEWGIGDLQRDFGIRTESRRPFEKQKPLIGLPKPLFGIERRLITQVPQGLTLTEHTIQPVRAWDSREKGEPAPCQAWYLEYRPRAAGELPTEINHVLLPITEWETVTCAWSERDFGIVAAFDEYDELGHIQELWEAFQRQDVIMGIFGGGVFENGGLTIAIASRIPEEYVQSMHDADEDHYNLLIAAEKTGIQARVDESGLRYFALSPRWADEEKEKDENNVVFWLNPEEQHANHYGLFTVEDLDAWIRGEGPIPKMKR